MIVPMKNVTLLCSEHTKEHTLSLLQQAGLMHLAGNSEQTSPDQDAAREDVERLQQIIAAIPEEVSSGPAPPPMSAQDAAENLWDSLLRLRAIHDRRGIVQQELDRIRPFGRFDPQTIRDLKDHGIFIRLYALPAARQVPEIRAGILVQTGADRNGRYLALISREESGLPDRETPLPTEGLDQMEAELAALQTEEASIRDRFIASSACRPMLMDHLARAKDTLAYEQARSGMQPMGPVAVIHGYIPESATTSLQRLAAESGWGYRLSDPGPGDTPPTLMRTPSWVRPIQAVFGLLNVLPGYRETDISAPFLIFLTLFFAMIIADAGYGLLLFGLCLILRSRLTRLHPNLVPFVLLMSLATMAWGLLTANVFGTQGPAFLKAVQVEWLSGPEAGSRFILLCFIIGAVHLSLAHVWRLIIFWPDLRAVSQAGWLLVTWVMFFAARSLVLLHDFPQVMFPLFGLGLAMSILFMRPLPDLWRQWTDSIRFPLDIISQFVDLVSYVRLFAVGAATAAVAQAFNDMALSVDVNGFLGALGTLVILGAGHSLNLILAGMGVLVHGVRLNTLEFATHAGITWSGLPYQPFALQARPAEKGAEYSRSRHEKKEKVHGT